jgi:anti-anti-sigma factor
VAKAFDRRIIDGPRGVRAGVLAVKGSIGGGTVEGLRGEIDALVKEGVVSVVIDCERVDYINSTGLGMLLLCLDELEAAGGRLVLSRVSDRAMLVIEMLGFGPALEIVSGEDEARELFWGEAA